MDAEPAPQQNPQPPPVPTDADLNTRIHAELRAVAAERIASARAVGRGWDATAVVHEAYLRLTQRGQLPAQGRAHLFFLFQRAMRDQLVEQYRAGLALKHGGGLRRVSLVELTADGTVFRADIADLQGALDELERADADCSRVLFYRFFAGMTLEEAAEMDGTTVAVVRQHWDYAKAWLLSRLAPHP